MQTELHSDHPQDDIDMWVKLTKIIKQTMIHWHVKTMLTTTTHYTQCTWCIYPKTDYPAQQIHIHHGFWYILQGMSLISP